MRDLVQKKCKNLEDKRIVIIPNWAGMELTYLKGWSNAALVKMLSQE